MALKSVTLYYSDRATGGSSDKVYVVELDKEGSGYVVNFQYGRRGSTLRAGTKTAAPVTEKEAERVYDSVVSKQMKEGYVPSEGTTLSQVMPASTSTRTKYPAELLEEVAEEHAEEFLANDRYAMEVKYDGERRQVERVEGGPITSYNKLGEAKPISGKVAVALDRLPFDSFHFDGELIGDLYVFFDVFRLNDFEAAKLPRDQRRAMLIQNIKPQGLAMNVLQVANSWETTKEKRAAFAALKEERFEGVCFKLKSAPYRAGRNGQHLKLKFLKTATFKVVGIGHKGHNSATLALLDGKTWREVGRASLNGKDSRIKIGSYVEVTFLNYTGSRLYQPRVKAYRNDVTDADCKFSQLKHTYKQGIEAA